MIKKTMSFYGNPNILKEVKKRAKASKTSSNTKFQELVTKGMICEFPDFLGFCIICGEAVYKEDAVFDIENSKMVCLHRRCGGLNAETK